jgi:hypothetical protein
MARRAQWLQRIDYAAAQSDWIMQFQLPGAKRPKPLSMSFVFFVRVFTGIFLFFNIILSP